MEAAVRDKLVRDVVIVSEVTNNSYFLWELVHESSDI